MDVKYAVLYLNIFHLYRYVRSPTFEYRICKPLKYIERGLFSPTTSFNRLLSKYDKSL